MSFLNFVNKKKLSRLNSGFGLVEVLVGVAIFVAISVAAYGGYVKILEGVQVLKIKNTATNLANEQIEIIHNLPYLDVGIVNGLPAGKILREQQIERAGMVFNVVTNIRDIDDPFDGQIGGEPNDLSPADYKLVEITITCINQRFNQELKYYARVAALALETQGNNGALFIQVSDANGQPIQGANIHVENNSSTSTIVIDETTNNAGMFQIVDAPVGVSAYEIEVSKGSDYSVDKTYTIGDVENPVPDKPHANVSSGQVTQVSFFIDKLSQLDIYTKRNTCERVANVDFNVHGSKTIGLNVYKTDDDLETNSAGFKNLDVIEWDNYFFTITDGGWDLAGASPILPVEITPDSEVSVSLILEKKEPNALLVGVIDAETQMPISDAEVSLVNDSTNITLITNRGFVIQTDWVGGGGQENYSDNETKYFSSNNIESSAVPGQIKLTKFSGTYSVSGFLESSTIDMGTTTNFGNIFWNPTDQPIGVGDDSIKIQIATNVEITATSTWDFVGPDNTGGTYYTSPGEAIGATHYGSRYLRYKIFLTSEDDSVSPSVSNISLTFTSECAPPGQVLFTDVPSGEYTFTISHDNYQALTEDNFIISEPWAKYETMLIPNE